MNIPLRNSITQPLSKKTPLVVTNTPIRIDTAVKASSTSLIN